jgi:hypothetical protein
LQARSRPAEPCQRRTHGMDEGRSHNAVRSATKTRNAFCGLTLELRRRARRQVIAATHHGRLERIVRPHPMRDLSKTIALRRKCCNSAQRRWPALRRPSHAEPTYELQRPRA